MSPAGPVREPAESPAATADALLAAVEPLPYPRRMRELALRARAMAGTPELAALLGELAGREPYERRTALHMAMAARELGHITAVLAGPDMDLRRAALRAVRTLPVPDDAAAAALEDAPSALRRAFYRTLLHSGRRGLADRLLPLVRGRWGDREAARLLPACGAATVRAAMPGLAHAVTAWRTLGRHHPEPVVEHAERELAGLRYGTAWWRRRGAGAEAAAARLPDRVAALLDAHQVNMAYVRLPPATAAAVLGTDRARAARLLARSVRNRAVPRRIARDHLRTCSPDEIAAMLPSRHRALPAFLEDLPPGLRAAAFDAAAEAGGGPRAGLNALPCLPLLPPERAAAEARRMLDWRGSVRHSSRSRADDPLLPLRLRAFLPYAEAAGPLAEAAFTGDPRRRGAARTLLLECAARTGDRAVVAGVVTRLAERGAGEQDPLRGSLLAALTALPPALLDGTVAGPFDRLATAAVAARDSSPGTRRVLRVLAARVLRHAEAPELYRWGLETYARLVARDGAEALAPAEPGPPSRRRARGGPRGARADRLDRVLRRGREDDLLDLLRPHLRAARDRGDLALAVAVARSLGRRAHAIGDLQDDLRAAALHAPEEIAREAVHLWLDAAGTREARAAELLANDPAAIAHPRVWSVVAGRRTDLLGAALDGGPPLDRVPEVTAGAAGRWTPGQRERARAFLGAAAADERLPVAPRLAAVRSLGRLPGTSAELESWAGGEDGLLAEAALDALSHGGDPDRALRVLLAHGRGAASAAAVAAMARCCARIAPSRLGPLLEEALTGPDGKVTVRKQAARQIERQRVPGGAGILLRAWEEPGLHRDVRIAVAAALRHLPEAPGTLEALGAAAGPHAGEIMLRTLFRAQPWDYAPGDRPRYAALVRDLLAAADGPGVRFRAARAFSAWVPWYEGGFEDVLAAVADPADPAGRRDLPVFEQLMRTGAVRDEALDVLDRLLAAGMSAEARHRVAALARVLQGDPGTRGAGDPLRALALRAVDRLAARPLYLGEAMRLAVTRLPSPEDAGPLPGSVAAGLTAGLLSIAGHLRGESLLAVEVCDRLSSRFRRYGNGCAVPPADLLPAVRRLRERGDLSSQLMALALAGAAGPAAGWSTAWREILDGLRDSRHVEVQRRAWEIEAD
ncbi:hypothetical protein [Spirillospora sp. NPDC029432]|uniref:hypothetical protein n=1 Tax=Spirillospora sp. NPDC029432 TaxID=3154599 RepID=UPI003451554E